MDLYHFDKDDYTDLDIAAYRAYLKIKGRMTSTFYLDIERFVRYRETEPYIQKYYDYVKIKIRKEKIDKIRNSNK